MTIGTEKIDPLAINVVNSAINAQMTINRVQNFDQLLVSVPVIRSLNTSEFRVAYMMKPRPGVSYYTRFVLEITRPNGTKLTDIIDFMVPSVNLGFGSSVRLPVTYLRTHVVAVSYTHLTLPTKA